MRCKACDEVLKAHELKRIGVYSGEYIDLCDACLETIAEDVITVDGKDDDEDVDASAS